MQIIDLVILFQKPILQYQQFFFISTILFRHFEGNIDM